MGGLAFTKRAMAAATGVAAALLSFTAATAQTTGQPVDWQMNMQAAASPIAERINSFHDMLLVIITVITLFVLALLLIVCFRFSEKKNPTPSKTTHNALLEVLWTVVPVIILVVIAIPSFRLLRDQELLPVNKAGERAADLTIKVTGDSAWYWNVEYPGAANNFKFDMQMLQKDDIAKLVKAGKKEADYPYLLAVDNEIVVPVNKVVRVQVTANGIIHSFSVPALGFRKDAVPGRLNETWFSATKEGVYYGQCSRLCGANHAFMPIAIRAVSDAAYASWLAEAKKKFASIDATTQVAANAAAPLN